MTGRECEVPFPTQWLPEQWPPLQISLVYIQSPWTPNLMFTVCWAHQCLGLGSLLFSWQTCLMYPHRLKTCKSLAFKAAWGGQNAARLLRRNAALCTISGWQHAQGSFELTELELYKASDQSPPWSYDCAKSRSMAAARACSTAQATMTRSCEAAVKLGHTSRYSTWKHWDEDEIEGCSTLWDSSILEFVRGTWFVETPTLRDLWAPVELHPWKVLATGLPRTEQLHIQDVLSCQVFFSIWKCQVALQKFGWYS